MPTREIILNDDEAFERLKNNAYFLRFALKYNFGIKFVVHITPKVPGVWGSTAQEYSIEFYSTHGSVMISKEMHNLLDHRSRPSRVLKIRECTEAEAQASMFKLIQNLESIGFDLVDQNESCTMIVPKGTL